MVAYGTPSRRIVRNTLIAIAIYAACLVTGLTLANVAGTPSASLASAGRMTG